MLFSLLNCHLNPPWRLTITIFYVVYLQQLQATSGICEFSNLCHSRNIHVSKNCTRVYKSVKIFPTSQNHVHFHCKDVQNSFCPDIFQADLKSVHATIKHIRVYGKLLLSKVT